MCVRVCVCVCVCVSRRSCVRAHVWSSLHVDVWFRRTVLCVRAVTACAATAGRRRRLLVAVSHHSHRVKACSHGPGALITRLSYALREGAASGVLRVPVSVSLTPEPLPP